jgi:hypothetical protein
MTITMMAMQTMREAKRTTTMTKRMEVSVKKRKEKDNKKTKNIAMKNQRTG